MKNGKSGLIVSQMYRSILAAQIVSLLVTRLGVFVDSFVVGNFVGTQALAVMGFVSPYTIIISALALMMSSGTGIVLGNCIGRGQYSRINGIFTTALTVSAAFAAVLILLTFVFSEQISGFLGVSADLMPQTTVYLQVVTVGYIPLMLSPVLVVFLCMGNKVAFCARISVLTGMVKIALSVLLVFLVSRDLYYIGLATTLSLYAGMVIYSVKLAGNPDISKFSMRSFAPEHIRDFFLKGLPLTVVLVCTSMLAIIINRCVMDIAGVAAVAGISIVHSTAFVLGSVSDANVTANSFLASIAIGEKDTESIKSIFRADASLALPLLAGLAALYGIFGSRIGMMFGLSGAELDYAGMCFAGFAFAFVPNMIFQNMNCAYSPAFGRHISSTLLTAVGGIAVPGIVCLAGWLLSDIHFLYYAFSAGSLCCLIIMIIISCVINRRFSLAPADIVRAEKEFAKTPGYRISLSASDMNGICSISEKIITFCRKSGANSGKSYFSGLCTEELAAVIMQHGFGTGNVRNGMIDIFVTVCGNRVEIRVRDNAGSFNPLDRLNIRREQDSDMCAAAGIKLVSAIAEKMEYRQTFKMNVTHFVI